MQIKKHTQATVESKSDSDYYWLANEGEQERPFCGDALSLAGSGPATPWRVPGEKELIKWAAHLVTVSVAKPSVHAGPAQWGLIRCFLGSGMRLEASLILQDIALAMDGLEPEDGLQWLNYRPALADFRFHGSFDPSIDGDIEAAILEYRQSVQCPEDVPANPWRLVRSQQFGELCLLAGHTKAL